MLQKYRITKVTHRGTDEPRIDKFYPSLIGQKFYLDVNDLKLGEVIHLITDKPFNPWFRTSKVQNYCYDGHTLQIITMNSVYHLEKVNED